MYILIVENDPLIVEDLQDKLETLGYPKTEIADNVADALALVKQARPDVVLVDIELNGPLSGIDLGGELHRKQIPFIYLSEMQNLNTFQLAQKTFPQTNLPKPVTLLQLRNSLLEIKTGETHENDFIFVNHGEKKHKIVKNDVSYLKAARNNCDIFLSNGKRFVSSTPMNNVMDKLSSKNLIQVHRSYSVNIEKVESYLGNMIHLEGVEEPIPISDTYRKDFLRNFDTV
ncbi:MAG: DNA-binding LytR/AlgR family response regulator [Crocinitomix sp.]|jgi:DNA-binding LytR/AlgR family response regulator